MSNKRTTKALEELVKTEHMAVAALDTALQETQDNKLRKNYRKWRDSHMKQAEALNSRLEDLGGEPVVYEVGSGKGQAKLWGKLTSLTDDTSLAGMRVGAERGIKRYIDHIDEIDDPKTLSIIRKNLESKQDEIEWYDDQASKERGRQLETKLEATSDKAVQIAGDGKRGGIPFPLIVALGAVGAAAFFLLRRNDESDYEDYGEDAFRYESEEPSMSTAGSESREFTSSGTQGNGATGMDYDSMSATGNTDIAG
jgi:bacterioferritin (cytochrome b1)